MSAAKRLHSNFLPLLVSSSLVVLGCGDNTTSLGSGDVQVFVEAESTIPNGISAGDGPEDIIDGWNVKYTRFIVTIGNFRAARSNGSDKLTAPNVYVLDLMKVPVGGYVVHTWRDVEATNWDRFGFDLPNATDAAIPLEPTTEADKALLVDKDGNKVSIYVEGEIDNGTDKKTFAWALPVNTAFDDCADANGLAGFAVPSGGSVAIKPTIHGDHWFFTSVTGGAEITTRRAQHIADCDLDGDGNTTIEELEAVKATGSSKTIAEVFPSDKYNLSGIVLDSAYDWVLGQARTLGDFQGEGECPTRKLLP